MVEVLKEFFSSKNIIINKYLIDISMKHNLSLKEFILLSYLQNGYCNSLDIEAISKDTSLDTNSVMEALNGLTLKNLLVIESSTVKDNILVNLDNLYKEISELIEVKEKKDINENIFEIFESEWGRPMSPTQLELINAWLDRGISEELIVGALREAVYNNVLNFRYIDRIIYEWDSKGLKNMKDVEKYLKNYRENKTKERVVTKQEQELLDLDWLNSE